MYLGILGANRTEDLLVARNEIVSSYYFFFLPILSGGILEGGLIDFCEIFRNDR